MIFKTSNVQSTNLRKLSNVKCQIWHCIPNLSKLKVRCKTKKTLNLQPNALPEYFWVANLKKKLYLKSVPYNFPKNFFWRNTKIFKFGTKTLYLGILGFNFKNYCQISNPQAQISQIASFVQKLRKALNLALKLLYMNVFRLQFE